MAKPLINVTAAELAILEQLWQDGPMVAKDLSLRLYGSVGPSDIATVQKLLSRLEAKDCVARDRNQWPHHFSASVSKQVLISQRLQATANELCDGKMTSLITHLVQAKKMTAKQRQKLRDMLDSLDQK